MADTRQHRRRSGRTPAAATPASGAQDDARRTALVLAAARIVADDGIDALSTRRLAAEVGTSTMAVYTWFGSKPNLMRAIFHEAFSRFRDRLRGVEVTDDPTGDLARMGWAYRAYALAEPHLYEIMFGRRGRQFTPTEQDAALAAETFQILVDAVARCVADGSLTCQPEAGALQIWAAVHGVVSLELANGPDADIGQPWPQTYGDLIVTLLVGLGGDPSSLHRLTDPATSPS